jgi:hypothetical protein
MVKTYDDIIHDDVELTAETVMPSAVTNIHIMSDEVAALCALIQALAIALNAGC